jgi:RHS repeat-associated protein
MPCPHSWGSPLASQTLSHRYDAAGRVDYMDDTLLGGSNRLDHGYDAADNRTSVIHPGGTSVTYAYDALNRLDTVTEGGVVLADYDWDPLSRRDLVKLNANAFSMDLGYEADDDLLSLAHTGPAPLTFSFGRNQSGQITSLAASDGASLSRPSASQALGYVPNRLNQYASVAGASHGHDANGNLSSDGVYAYEYDEENHLRSAVGGGFTTSYEYEPLGRRRAKVVNGTTTRYVSDNAEEVEERHGANAILRRYVYGSGIDERIAMLDSACTGGRCYYLTNWQHSTTTLVNQTGTLNATYRYGPYGEGANWTPSDALTGNPFRYTGRRIDPETGLYYYRARYYSPRLGRFLQTDPVGTKDDLNLYAFVKNDVLNSTDPSGLCETASTCAQDHDNRAFLRGDISAQELQTRNNARAAGTVTGAIVVAVVLTRGAILKAFGKREEPQKSAAPNPRGSRGSQEHQDRIDERIGELKDEGMTHRAGGPKPEEKVRTPGGRKESRRPDITMEREDGSMYRENVGRANKHGTPVKRERDAMQDIEEATGQCGFSSYCPKEK